MAPIKDVIMGAVTEQDKERLEPFDVEVLALRTIKGMRDSAANQYKYQQTQADRVRRLCKQAADCPSCKPIYK